MLRYETFTCQKCGKRFKAATGGIVMTPKEQHLRTYPVCPDCKVGGVIGLFKPKK